MDVNSSVRKSSHKYGIEIPTSVEDAKRIDRKNGTTYCKDAISKEMFNVGISFNFLEDDEYIPPGYKISSVYLISGIKTDFKRKTWWVKYGYRNIDPDSSSYAVVVSR